MTSAVRVSSRAFTIDGDGYAPFAWVASFLGPLAFVPPEVLELRDGNTNALLGYRTRLAAMAPDYSRGGAGWTPATAGVPWAYYQTDFAGTGWQAPVVVHADEFPPREGDRS